MERSTANTGGVYMLREKKGFTLIELLVVIAIIAILAAILFPIFMRAKQQANQAKCLANLRQIGSSCTLYSQDYADCVPLCRHFGKAWRNDVLSLPSPANPNKDLPDLLQKYAKSRNSSGNANIYMCPSIKPHQTIVWNNGGSKWTAASNDYVSYIWNHFYWDPVRKNPKFAGMGDYWEHRFQVSGTPLNEAKRLTKAPLLWDIPYWGQDVASHNKGLNVLYADGHAKWALADDRDNSPNNGDWYFNHSGEGWCML